MGNDLSRGILMFSKSKRLGERGLQWLKIHIANKMGHDKLSFIGREKWTEDNKEMLFKIAQDPLKNTEWQEQEDCWQALAAIQDLYKAYQLENPEDYESNLHVHVDGSCNGLQHYAAMGRDKDAAAQVNLLNKEKPGDLYSHIAGMVNSIIDKDAQNPQSAYYETAKSLQGKVVRKTIKQTVMTTVYGVSFIGARAQIKKQILKYPELDHSKCSYYLARLTLDSVGDLFNCGTQIKNWLTLCAQVISSKSCSVQWITPLGLPVTQPYKQNNRYDFVQTISLETSLELNHDQLSVNKRKQQTAFPPNFVHSLDSCHMLKTAEQAKIHGIDFAAVHDSYWTHAADVDLLQKLLREQFVDLHSQPLLQTLKGSFEKQFPGVKFPEIPGKGQFDLEEVKKSSYFFS